MTQCRELSTVGRLVVYRWCFGVAIWVACGVYGWGTMMAYCDYRNTHDWEILHEHSRDDVGICAFIAAMGPFGAVNIAVISNFNQHGWEFWERGNRMNAHSIDSLFAVTLNICAVVLLALTIVVIWGLFRGGRR